MPIQQALRGTQETIRYIGSDIAASKRRLAESKLLGAQMEYKKAAAESEMDIKREEMNINKQKLQLMIDEKKPVKVKDAAALWLGHNPELYEKVMASGESVRPGFGEIEMPADRISAAFKAMVESFSKQTRTLTPKQVAEVGGQLGDIMQEGFGGKLSVVRKAPTVKTISATTLNRLEGKVLDLFSEEIKSLSERTGATFEEIRKNPTAHFSETHMSVLNAVNQTAGELKRNNPNMSDLAIGKKAKKIVYDEVFGSLITKFQSLETPEEKQGFMNNLKQDPYALKKFKEYAAKVDKKGKTTKTKPGIGSGRFRGRGTTGQF